MAQEIKKKVLRGSYAQYELGFIYKWTKHSSTIFRLRHSRLVTTVALDTFFIFVFDKNNNVALITFSFS